MKTTYKLHNIILFFLRRTTEVRVRYAVSGKSLVTGGNYLHKRTVSQCGEISMMRNLAVKNITHHFNLKYETRKF